MARQWFGRRGAACVSRAAIVSRSVARARSPALYRGSIVPRASSPPLYLRATHAPAVHECGLWVAVCALRGERQKRGSGVLDEELLLLLGERCAGEELRHQVQVEALEIARQLCLAACGHHVDELAGARLDERQILVEALAREERREGTPRCLVRLSLLIERAILCVQRGKSGRQARLRDDPFLLLELLDVVRPADKDRRSEEHASDEDRAQ